MVGLLVKGLLKAGEFLLRFTGPGLPTRILTGRLRFLQLALPLASLLAGQQVKVRKKGKSDQHHEAAHHHGHAPDAFACGTPAALIGRLRRRSRAPARLAGRKW